MEKNLNMHYRYMEHRIRPGSRRDFSVFAYKSRNILDILSSPDMHYLRAPFALLATTFVIDVLATPMNVPIRRDGPLDVNFIIVDLAVQLLKDDVDSLSSSTNQSETDKFLGDLSVAANGVENLAFYVAEFDPFDKNASQTFANNFITPFLQHLNDTGKELHQQANVVHDLVPNNFTFVLASLSTLMGGISDLNDTVSLRFTSDVVQDLSPVFIGVETVFTNTYINYTSFP